MGSIRASIKYIASSCTFLSNDKIQLQMQTKIQRYFRFGMEGISGIMWTLIFCARKQNDLV